jgi:hypothetical protein
MRYTHPTISPVGVTDQTILGSSTGKTTPTCRDGGASSTGAYEVDE